MTIKYLHIFNNTKHSTSDDLVTHIRTNDRIKFNFKMALIDLSLGLILLLFVFSIYKLVI